MYIKPTRQWKKFSRDLGLRENSMYLKHISLHICQAGIEEDYYIRRAYVSAFISRRGSGEYYENKVCISKYISS